MSQCGAPGGETALDQSENAPKSPHLSDNRGLYGDAPHFWGFKNSYILLRYMQRYHTEVHREVSYGGFIQRYIQKFYIEVHTWISYRGVCIGTFKGVIQCYIQRYIQKYILMIQRYRRYVHTKVSYICTYICIIQRHHTEIHTEISYRGTMHRYIHRYHTEVIYVGTGKGIIQRYTYRYQSEVCTVSQMCPCI